MQLQFSCSIILIPVNDNDPIDLISPLKLTNLDIVHEEDVGVQEDPGVEVGQHVVDEEPSGGADPEHADHLLQTLGVADPHAVEPQPVLRVHVPRPDAA